jgi:triosephosphate isomerase (TIM)
VASYNVALLPNMSRRTPLVAANWKMNGSQAANSAWMKAFGARRQSLSCDVVVCAPAVYLAALAAHAAEYRIDIGAQDVSERSPGAFTGDVAAAMLADIGCRWVIVGHSERRQLHGESDEMVAAKAGAALAAGLGVIVCVGESLAEREAGSTLQVVKRQLDAVLARIGAEGLARGALAYEPVWAIGTGRTATPVQAQEVHAALRVHVAGRDETVAGALRILYGGSVKPANATELFGQPDIDGGLIGGASLVADDFAAICAAAR